MISNPISTPNHHEQMSLFVEPAILTSRARVTKGVYEAAKSLMAPCMRCETCGIGTGDAVYGSGPDWRTYYNPFPALDGWRDAMTGAPTAQCVEYDGFPPSSAELAVYYLHAERVVVVRCKRHRPKSGKKVA